MIIKATLIRATAEFNSALCLAAVADFNARGHSVSLKGPGCAPTPFGQIVKGSVKWNPFTGEVTGDIDTEKK
jgi:hypothetical protein